MKKLSLILFLFIFIFKPVIATTYSSDPEMFVSEIVKDAINKLSDKNLSKEEKSAYVESIAKKMLILMH